MSSQQDRCFTLTVFTPENLDLSKAGTVIISIKSFYENIEGIKVETSVNQSHGAES